MPSYLKLLFFLTLAAGIVLAGYVAYRYFNEKIIGSRTLFQLLLYTFLLIAVCAGLLLLGVGGLVTVYRLLK